MLEHYGALRCFHDGEVFFRQGARGEEMYVVRSGKVAIYATDNGVDTTLAVLGQHDFFGEMSLLTGEPRSASARAQGEVEASVIDRETFNRIVSEPLVHDMLVRMSQRIRDVDRELEKLSSSEVIRREHISHIIEQRQWFA